MLERVGPFSRFYIDFMPFATAVKWWLITCPEVAVTDNKDLGHYPMIFILLKMRHVFVTYNTEEVKAILSHDQDIIVNLLA